MNELIHETIKYLNDSGLGGLIGMIVFMCVMSLGFKLVELIRRL